MMTTGENEIRKFYTDQTGEWRWRRTASNFEMIGTSREGSVQLSSYKGNVQRNRYTVN